jgi:hypothetical protein
MTGEWSPSKRDTARAVTHSKRRVEEVLISVVEIRYRCGGLFRRSVRLWRTPLLAMGIIAKKCCFFDCICVCVMAL